MKKNSFKIFFLIFLILQPIFDSYYLYSDEVINLFGFSPTTIIRMIVVALCALIVFIKKDKKKKNILIFSFITIIYFIIHHFVSTSINDGLIYSSFRYSIVEEIFYFLRMLLPIGVIYIVYNLKYTKEDLKMVIKYSSILLILIVVLLNIFGIARASYGSGFITGSIFDWFNINIDRYSLASKGWFNSANQVSALLIIFIVMMEYFTLEEKKVSDLIVTLLLILSSMMIGTRVSTLGVFAIIIFLMLCYFVIKKINHKRIEYDKYMIRYCILILVFTGIVFRFAPIVNCHGDNYKCILSINGGLSSDNIIEVPKDLKYDGDTCNFLKKTPANEEYYGKLYPCESNIEFWDDFTKNKVYEYANNRTMEVLVTNDVYSKISNPLVNLFGMGRSRFLGAKIYLEKDIYVHYYTIGIVGVILFLIIPYLVPIFILCVKMLVNKKINYYDFCLCFSVFVVMAVSYLSGHILDELIVTLYLGFIVGIVINRIKLEEKKKYVKRTLIINDERMMGGVSVLLEDILNNINKDIEVDLLILHNNGTRLENLPSNVNIIYGTRFFRTIDLPIKEVLKTKNVGLIFNKVMLVFLMKTHLISYKIKIERNKILKYRYEQEIAFKDGFCGLFVAYGDADRKVQWLHSDYAKKDYLENYRSLFMHIFNDIDIFVAVSKNVGKHFNNIYHQSNKTIVIENIVDEVKIKEKSKLEKVKYDGNINIVSVGRLHKDKGFDRVINVLSKLKEENKLGNIKYYIIGDGTEYDNLKKLISDKGLNDNIFMLGNKENPYPYFKAADLFVMSSFHESYGLVIVEALILGIPVLSTKIATIYDILDEKYGLIVDNSFDGLYNGIRKIIDENLIPGWKKNLKDYECDNKKIIEKIERLLLVKE